MKRYFLVLHKQLCAALILSALWLFSVAQSQAVPAYSLTDISHAPHALALAINNQNHVLALVDSDPEDPYVFINALKLFSLEGDLLGSYPFTHEMVEGTVSMPIYLNDVDKALLSTINSNAAYPVMGVAHKNATHVGLIPFASEVYNPITDRLNNNNSIYGTCSNPASMNAWDDVLGYKFDFSNTTPVLTLYNRAYPKASNPSGTRIVGQKFSVYPNQSNWNADTKKTHSACLSISSTGCREFSLTSTDPTYVIHYSSFMGLTSSNRALHYQVKLNTAIPSGYRPHEKNLSFVDLNRVGGQKTNKLSNKVIIPNNFEVTQVSGMSSSENLAVIYLKNLESNGSESIPYLVDEGNYYSFNDVVDLPEGARARVAIMNEVGTVILKTTNFSNGESGTFVLRRRAEY